MRMSEKRQCNDALDASASRVISGCAPVLTISGKKSMGVHVW
jgi:hypothetical protein